MLDAFQNIYIRRLPNEQHAVQCSRSNLSAEPFPYQNVLRFVSRVVVRSRAVKLSLKIDLRRKRRRSLYLQLLFTYVRDNHLTINFREKVMRKVAIGWLIIGKVLLFKH